jgi:hypothetical protein
VIKDSIIRSLFGLSILLLAFSGIIAVLNLPLDSGAIIIRFDSYHDEVVWADSVGVFFGVIGLALFMVIVNFLLAREVYDRRRFLSYIIGAGTLVVASLFLVATLAVTLIN